MRRVLHVSSLPATLDLFVRPFEAAAAAAGYEFSYLTGAPGPVERVSVPLQRGWRSIASWRSQAELLSAVSERRPDIVQVHTPATALALRPILSQLRARLLYTARGGFDEGRSVALRAAWAIGNPAAWKCWDGVAVVNSDQVADLAGTSKRVVKISGGGLPLPAVQRRAEPPSDGVVRLLWVGRLDRDKRPDHFLEVVRMLRHQGLPVTGTLVGGVLPGDRPPRNLVQRLGAHPFIEHAGWQQDVLPYYRGADLVVLTTRREGFGRVPLEAAAVGTPTVAYSTRGTRESVALVHGAVLERNDPGALCSFISDWAKSAPERRAAWRREVHGSASAAQTTDVWGEWNACYEQLL